MANFMAMRWASWRKPFELALASAIGLLATSGSAGSQSSFNRTYADYIPPSVSLIQTNGKPVSFASLVDGSRPVVLEFFYTSCSTICGMQASTLAGAQAGLGRNAVLVSVSIDPEYDTPTRLRDYARNFPVGGNWYLLTGKRADITRVLTNFDARPFGDNKMLHRPYVFIRTYSGRQWLRLEGLTSSRQIVDEVRGAIAHPPPQSSTMSSLRESLNRLIGG